MSKPKYEKGRRLSFGEAMSKATETSPQKITRGSAYSRKWRESHQEQFNEYQLKYRKEHKEEAAEYGREYRAKHREEERLRNKAWRMKNHNARNAQASVERALRLGKIKKPSFCSCGNPATEAHHDDYNKPLDIEWLCRLCHAKLSKRSTRHHV